MTAVARGRGLHVFAGLAEHLRVGAVVTGRTGTGCDAGMAEPGARERDSALVAGLAGCGGLYVVAGFGGVGEAAAFGVAERALCRRALEHAAHVAGFAFHTRVCASQREAGAQVVEARATTALRSRSGKREQSQRQASDGGQVVGGEAGHAVFPFSGMSHVDLPCLLKTASRGGGFGRQRGMPPTPGRSFLNELVT